MADPEWGQEMRIAVVILTVILALGCTHFSVVLPDGTQVNEVGAPLLSRQGEFLILHEWLDEATNTLHEVRVSRNVEENADAQYRALNRMASLVEALVLKGINPE